MRQEAVLVTGGAGYIGSHTVLALLARGYNVVVIDNLSTGVRCAVPEPVKCYIGDVGNTELVKNIVRDNNVTSVIHFAGSISVPESIMNPLKYYKNNAFETTILVAALVELGIKRIVFSSTAAVYGLTDADLVSEEAALNPINPYGRSKLFAEEIIHDLARLENCSTTILRYFNVGGADPRGRAGQRNEGASHLIRIALEVAVGLRPSLTVFGGDYDTRDGTCERDFIHVSDLADVHVLALERMELVPGICTYNCGYGVGSSVLEVIDAVASVSGRPVPYLMAGRRLGDAGRVVADPRKIFEELGWKPLHGSLTEIVQTALSWQIKLAR